LHVALKKAYKMAARTTAYNEYWKVSVDERIPIIEVRIRQVTSTRRNPNLSRGLKYVNCILPQNTAKSHVKGKEAVSFPVRATVFHFEDACAHRSKSHAAGTLAIPENMTAMTHHWMWRRLVLRVPRADHIA
jgi:hypothetical protein